MRQFKLEDITHRELINEAWNQLSLPPWLDLVSRRNEKGFQFKLFLFLELRGLKC